MTKQIIEYSAAACGAGKTQWAVEWMAAKPSLYLYAVDRIEEFEVRTQRISAAAQRTQTTPFITTLSSAAGLSVVQEFPRRIETLSQFSHAVLIITHAALKLVDHSVCADWTLIIDEDPKLWTSDVLDLGASRPFWDATYNLEPIDDLAGYSAIRLKASAPSFHEVGRDALTRPIAALHDRIRRSKVTVKLTDWDQLTQRLTWFAIWDVTDLAIYRRVIILANSFDQLLTAKLIRISAPNVELRPIAITRSQDWAPRAVRINYVASDHTATVNHLANTKQGHDIVARWSAWVSRLVSSQHYWCANLSFAMGAIPGVRISPKIAGSNAYAAFHECSALYAAKASTNEARVFADLAGGTIAFDDIRRDREFEDLIQIVFRSSLRDPASTAAVTLNVYDIEQAEFLSQHFTAAGFPFSITLAHHDIGAQKTKQKRGPKPQPDRPRKSAAERCKAYRERKKAEAA
ncbi:hypothetical protein [Brevundimonas diminuta]|uniref:hypothetical protein n=1 Tax=Brevundimonas diminuta TaxID=293 RepID=UPI001F5A4DE1|nr:hypothetical protein [Brevundimonas diminuta]